MAFEIIEPPEAYKLPLINEPQLNDGKLSVVSIKAIFSFMRQVAMRFNNGISWGTGELGMRAGNVNGYTVVMQTPSTANEEFRVGHGLKRVAIGAHVIYQYLNPKTSGATEGILLVSRPESWGVDHCYFKFTGKSAVLRFVLV
jgi:hypothetical protein